MGSGRGCMSRLIFLIVIVFAIPAYAEQNATNSTSNRRGKALNISKKPCSDPTGRHGICTFKWDCINQNGTKIGTCMDGFIVGTCCYYFNDPVLYSDDLENQLNNKIYHNQHKYHKPYKNNDDLESNSDGIFIKDNTISSNPTTENPITHIFSKVTPAGSDPQLLTWTVISPTKIPNKRPGGISKFPFPNAVSYPQFQGSRWPIGIAVPVNPLQLNRPLHPYRPSYYNSYFSSSNHKLGFKKHPTISGNFTIFTKPDNSSKNSSTGSIEMTTVSVPIPQWTSTKTANSIPGPIINPINRLPVPVTVKPGTSSIYPSSKPTMTTFASHQSTGITQLQKKKKPLLDYRKDCGVRALGSRARIVGGMSSYFGKWPWQILVKEAAWLGLYHKNKCGGVLISSKYAITAGHCQPGFLSSLIVLLGEYNLAADFEVLKPEMRRVKRMVVHRHYNPQNFDNDIAILELDPPVIFRPHISPICLPEKNEDFTGTMAYVTGWGKTAHGGSIPNLLQEVQVPIVNNAKCLSMFKTAGHMKIIKDNFLCAGYETGGKDSCEGDSGGPLMVQREDGQWVLAGTVSHGIRCADPNLPGVYMRISSYRTWIDKIIGSK